MTALVAADVIRLLDLRPHPEGGHYRETFRDTCMVANARAASSAIYYLLGRGERSAWHRIDAVEIWHWYAGAALSLSIRDRSGETIATRLGPQLLDGERPQAVVPAGAWQAAESLGEWTLVGCTVAPGFSFAAFELAPGDVPPQLPEA